MDSAIVIFVAGISCFVCLRILFLLACPSVPLFWRLHRVLSLSLCLSPLPPSIHPSSPPSLSLCLSLSLSYLALPYLVLSHCVCLFGCLDAMVAGCRWTAERAIVHREPGVLCHEPGHPSPRVHARDRQNLSSRLEGNAAASSQSLDVSSGGGRGAVAVLRTRISEPENSHHETPRLTFLEAEINPLDWLEAEMIPLDYSALTSLTGLISACTARILPLIPEQQTAATSPLWVTDSAR